MPPWILLLGLSVPLAMALYNKYGGAAPAGIDPGTGQPVAFDPSNPGFFQSLVYDVTQLSPSQGALDFIRQTEDLSLVPYRDAVGLWTIGYGHKIVPGDHYWPYGSVNSISNAEAETQFEADVDVAAQNVRALVRVPLSQGQFDSLVSFDFNTGGTALRVSTLLAKLNAGDYAGASQEFTRWVYGTENGAKVVLAGLVTRRLQEQATFNA